MNKDICSILLDIHVFTPKRPRTPFLFKPLSTKQIITPYFHFLSDLVWDSIEGCNLMHNRTSPEVWNLIRDINYLTQGGGGVKPENKAEYMKGGGGPKLSK